MRLEHSVRDVAPQTHGVHHHTHAQIGVEELRPKGRTPHAHLSRHNGFGRGFGDASGSYAVMFAPQMR
eukprot:scaffold16_cov242-Pinguiococcus_pyrenoidosus.AAC.10